MRLVKLRLPNTRTAAVEDQAAREAQATAADEEKADTMAFLDAARDWSPDEDVFWRETPGEDGFRPSPERQSLSGSCPQFMRE